MKTHGSGTSTILCYANRQGYGSSIGNRMRVVCMARGRVVGRMKRTATLMFSVETCGRVRPDSSREEPQRQSTLVNGKLSIRTTKHHTMKTYGTVEYTSMHYPRH